MKRTATILTILVSVLAMLFAGCGTTTPTPPPSPATPPSTATLTPTPIPTPTATPMPSGGECTVLLGPGLVDYDGSDLVPGDVVCLAAGTYSQIRFWNLSGTAANPITIRNNGGLVQMTGTNEIQFRQCEHWRFTGSGVASIEYGIRSEQRILVFDLCTDFEIDHIEIRNTTQGGGMDIKDTAVGHEDHVMQNVHVHHNYLHGLTREAIYIGSSLYNTHPGDFEMRHVEVDHNVIRNVGEGIQVGSVVEDCKVHHNDLRDINPQRDGNHTYSGIAFTQGVDGVIYNNEVRDCKGIGILLDEGYYANRVYNNLIVNVGHTLAGYYHGMICYQDNNAIYNNTIVTVGHGGNGDGIHLMNTSGNDMAFNNVILDVEGESMHQGGSPGVSFHHNLTKDDGHTPAYFGFVDPVKDDYHLTESSPAVDAGAEPPFLLTFDLDDRPRPSGAYDVGAYEFVGD